MAKTSSQFVCQSCGTVHSKWNGKCEGCGEWNTLVEETLSVAPGSLKPTSKKNTGTLEFTSLDEQREAPERIKLGVEELDRVFGGGLVPASATLIGGDPGIGKSTLLLQVTARLARNGMEVVYVSGEEAAAQIQDRAERLKISASPVKLATETDLRTILSALKKSKPDFVVIDSIQTLWSDSVEAAPGSVSQVRACAQELVRFAKRSGCALVIVGHVTKEGQIAGPRVVEHMVDTVFYFEGERGHQFRILRAVKNRFGPTDEIGIFEMSAFGLSPAKEPSALFLSSEDERTGGAAVFAAMEGSRPMLAEVQALGGPAAYGTPRRSVVGWDTNRLAMMIAVLEARCGIQIGGRDIYLSVAGGYRINEPAGDLASAAALLSSISDTPLPEKAIFFGEIALSGAIRPVARMEARIKEAERLGFRSAFGPEGPQKRHGDLTYTPIKRLSDLVDMLGIKDDDG
ncbi:DNA repair protein RadA [Ponticaulis sp.]|uniref:DNA repair protein RadA n=1 Tax=Ponticaulis sp. TaxID=2020902 RepID=UPI000B6FA65A|nr:DNA repair protein RadA [Ponticaulis sp.]MAI91943.1 DNA repair protein RadA [Ponticaulis sp.]OUX96416.1 MAG: DNA repair protein RadA [Hyphomonadaceae bacterium TMED5]|tara:strand:- start:19708 stop:21081 length:1374 start_codon:yes stop_codon:yes gene_type:complete